MISLCIFHLITKPKRSIDHMLLILTWHSFSFFSSYDLIIIGTKTRCESHTLEACRSKETSKGRMLINSSTYRTETKPIRAASPCPFRAAQTHDYHHCLNHRMLCLNFPCTPLLIDQKWRQKK